MLHRFIAWMRGVFSRMFHTNDAKRALGVEVAIGDDMQGAIDTWAQMFQDKAPWLNSNTQSLSLPAAIAGELARLVTVEMSSQVTGGDRATRLQEDYTPVQARLRKDVELAAAGGGLAFKPYVASGRVVVEAVPAWRFLPTAFNGLGEVTGAAFVEQVTKGRTFYTRMEHHQLTAAGYIIRNLAFRSSSASAIGTQCDLGSIEEWAELEPELTIRYKDGTAPERALFAYFKMPFANTIDLGSPLGVSAYSRAEDLIREADRQYSRILWEYEGSELAIDASIGALMVDGPEGKTARVPERRKRLFRELVLDQGQSGDLYKVYSPAIRDESLFNGLDKLLKRIEFNCYLSYGTLSDPQAVDKTAEEIKSSKQRSYSAVCDIQKSLQGALEHLIWAMDLYTTLYGLAPKGDYEVSFAWGDGVMENTELEFARRKMLVDGGYLRPEKLIAWYFGITEEEARTEYLQKAAPTMFEG